MRIAELRASQVYPALSYVWGCTANFQLEPANRHELLQPHSLTRNWDFIPQTIRDAMFLTAKLSLRYLWVDSMCIVQDDDENKTKHIAQMGSIYEHATFTIVAADGTDANHGLRGLGDSPCKAPPRKVLSLSSSAKFIFEDDWTFPKPVKTYNKRGWTFQEYYLSQRLLGFVDNKVLWRCRQCEHPELMNAERPVDHLSPGDFREKSTWPNFSLYMNLVQDYNS
ncbi:HET-domain-containing protein [Ophiobolus disseminans]|uniref:HET-domain-containing protein n=1 Tax=Ophiobolus disseminans TaxID=1469910 RepID=A0A6A6ZVF8_9PLEO|nr:HET-domain-containing protein [Ophiobolus disseminans]